MVREDGYRYVVRQGPEGGLRYDAPSGVFIDEFVSGGDHGLDTPSRMAFGPDGNFYVSSRSAGSSFIARYDEDGNFIVTTDFRSYLGGVVEGAFGVAAGDVFDAKTRALEVVS